MLEMESDQQLSNSLQTYLHDPHHFFGIHQLENGKKVIRVWRPGAKEIHLKLFEDIVNAHCIDQRGIFEVEVPAHTTAKDYQIYHTNGLLAHDPYAFTPTFGDIDAHLFNKGVHYQLFNILGARLVRHQDIDGVKFAVWAPSAQSVSLVGDFNHWDGRMNPMRSMGSSGVWELFVPGLKKGEKYKFEIRTPSGQIKVKTDPYALWHEKRPLTASAIWESQFSWTDEEWMQKKKRQDVKSQPMNAYEVHLGSWKRKDGDYLNYKEIAHQLVDYCKLMHFSHVELMPVAEHPYDESWGYQVTGFFAPTSRFGTPDDFQYFVNYLHLNEIGVILDWVPAHFPSDDFSLREFDGTSLYEHEDPRQGFHPHWSTHIFNIGRHEVSNFLIASALFWLQKMHIDGLRVDAVASMLYLDYGRAQGQWIPNPQGGRENLESIEFIKHLNSVAHQQCPGCIMIAEESTAFPGVTTPVEWGGLGFDLKWNLGWMNDTLHYFHVDPVFRHHHQNDLTFGLLYAFSEKFILVLSHDEVVHGKASLLSKMPGDDWQKFANLRLLYSYMMCQPGKKLLFMGGELGQWNEWNCRDELPWHLLQYDRHKGIHECVKQLNALYHQSPALWKEDFNHEKFEWIDFSDRKNCVLSYLRKGDGQYFACVHNFTPEYVSDYRVHLQNVTKISEVFNSDREEFGGSGKINPSVMIEKDAQGHTSGFTIRLAPLATMVFQVEFLQ